jgi:bifunctional DNA-binding transcriptional regulator/antitoxin component of YhaV-PrlF toxin-antitoxin module
MAEIIFRGGSVQKGDRIKIPPAIVDTLGLKPGEKIVILFDIEKKEIVIKEEKEWKHKN